MNVEELLDLMEETLEAGTAVPFAAAKRARNAADFNDLEHFAVRLLYDRGEPSRLAKTLSEGFAEIARKFRMVADIEKSHEERYLKLLENVEMQKVFEKSEEVMWVCRNCGHLVIGKKAPQVCPVCAHPQSFFEVKASNY